jgi:hypothetical protein
VHHSAMTGHHSEKDCAMHCSTLPRENPALVRSISRLDTDTPTEALARSPQFTDPLTCYRCGALDIPHIAPGKGPHCATLQCASCRAFIRWVSHYSPAEREIRCQQGRLRSMAQDALQHGRVA